MDFENRVYKKEGVFKPGDEPPEIRKTLAQSYLNNEFMQIQALEEKMINQVQENVSTYHTLSMFFPTTAYKAANDELSSRGYMTLLEFSRYATDYKGEFVKFILDKIYFQNFSKVVSFVTNDKNVFNAHPRLPDTFLWFVLFTLSWIMGLITLSSRLCKASIFRLTRSEKNLRQVDDTIIKKELFNGYEVVGECFGDQLYILLSGKAGIFKKSGYTHKVFLDDLDLTTGAERQDFLYLCHPTNIPGDIRVRHFLALIMDLGKVDKAKRKEIIDRSGTRGIAAKRFGQLSIDELGTVFLPVLDVKPFRYYLLNNVTDRMYIEFTVRLKDRLNELMYKGHTIIYLDAYSTTTSRASKKGYYYRNSLRWYNQVENFRNLPPLEEG